MPHTLFHQGPSAQGVTLGSDKDEIFELDNPYGAFSRSAFDQGLFKDAPVFGDGFTGEIARMLNRRAQQGSALFRIREALGGRNPTTPAFEEFSRGFLGGMFGGGTQPIGGQETLSGIVSQLLGAAQNNPSEALSSFIQGASEDPRQFVQLLMQVAGLRGIDPLAARAMSNNLENAAANWLGTLSPSERSGTNFVNELAKMLQGSRVAFGSTGVSRN